MRKVMLTAIVLLLSVVLVACGGDNNNKDKNANADNNKETNIEVNENNNETPNNTVENNEIINKNEGTNNNASAEGDTGFEDLIIYLDAMGLEPGDPVEQEAAVSHSLGAEKGIILPIADIDVQFFIYDENGENFNQEQYDQASSDDEVTLDIGAGETLEIPLKINGDYGLALYEDHYKKDELVEAFESF